MDTSSGAIPERPRKRRVKAKLSFASTCTGNSRLPCHLQADLTDLNVLLERLQKSEADEHRSDLTINATEETGPTKAITIGENCEAESVRSSKPSVENCEAATPTVVDTESRIRGNDQAVKKEKPEPKSLSKTDVLDIMRQLRQVLQKKGPSQEHDTVEAVSLLHAKLMPEMHGTMTAFPDTRPGHTLTQEDVYSFVHYRNPCHISAVAESKWTKEMYDSGKGQLQEKRDALRQSTDKVQQQRASIGVLPKQRAPPPESRRSEAERNKSPTMKNLKHTDAKATVAKVKPQPPLPRPRPPPCQSTLPLRPTPKNKP
ncbi:hypothetical protein HPB50_008352 [Hyalomma asiaticum]|uniref:Uncharacterized protein n=1 Tax=Hyalomma asiaticum TaxID=266040 RepID=A0ACB7SWL0_HYAAI|nr:hypothetical protein HPB50_008352 [Hyalomma asiaticum]